MSTGIDRIRELADGVATTANEYPNRETKAELKRAAAILYRHVALALEGEAEFLLSLEKAGTPDA